MSGGIIFIAAFKNGVTVRKNNVLPDTQQAKFHCAQVCRRAVWFGVTFSLHCCQQPVPSLQEQ